MANYTVLARKYRPTTFEEVVGQESVKSGMRNSILNNSIHPLYILSGTRGVGKTTIARIFTKAMNCENFAKNLEPCGHCESCKAIDEGSFIDLVEIDAASKNKVEDARELIKTLVYPPSFAKYRVFIIDEVHMLSKQSFDAFLKTFEEPPEYAKFILCTTEERKIPPTIISRSIHYHLKAFTTEQIEQQLRKILTLENIPFENKAVLALAEAGNGSMRDCLSLADQAIAVGNQQVTTKAVYEMLGLMDDALPTDLVIALLTNSKEQFQAVFKKIIEKQTDWTAVTNQVLSILYQASVIPNTKPDDYKKYGITNELLIEYFNKPKYDLRPFVEVSQVIYEIFNHALKLLEYNPHPSQVFHMSCIRALSFSSEEHFIVQEPAFPIASSQPLSPTFNKSSIIRPTTTHSNISKQPSIDYIHSKKNTTNLQLDTSGFEQQIKQYSRKNTKTSNVDNEFAQFMSNLTGINNNSTATTNSIENTKNSTSQIILSNNTRVNAHEQDFQQLAYTDHDWKETSETNLAELASLVPETNISSIDHTTVHQENTVPAVATDSTVIIDMGPDADSMDHTEQGHHRPINTLTKVNSSVSNHTDTDFGNLSETNQQIIQHDHNITNHDQSLDIETSIVKHQPIMSQDITHSINIEEFVGLTQNIEVDDTSDKVFKEQILLPNYETPEQFERSIKKQINQVLAKDISRNRKLIFNALAEISYSSKFNFGGNNQDICIYPKLSLLEQQMQRQLTTHVPELALFDALQLPTCLFEFIQKSAIALNPDNKTLYLDVAIKNFNTLEQEADKQHQSKRKSRKGNKHHQEDETTLQVSHHNYASEIEQFMQNNDYQVVYVDQTSSSGISLDTVTHKVALLAEQICTQIKQEFGQKYTTWLVENHMLPPKVNAISQPSPSTR